MVTLKDGSTSEDRRLDRLIQFDERSRSYPVAVAGRRPRSYTWRITKPAVLDQGREGACVGFSIAHELLARPAETRFGSEFRATRFAIEDVYYAAQRIDPWPGGSYPGADPHYDGTSILAGVKVTQALGYFQSYRWAFGLRDLVDGLGHNGPSVLGVNWYDSMYSPDGEGFIRPEGSIVGGHAILARAVTLKWKSHRFIWWKRTWDDVDLNASFVTLRNSWGPLWGRHGDCYITLRDLDVLLQQRGESVFFLDRTASPPSH